MAAVAAAALGYDGILIILDAKRSLLGLRYLTEDLRHDDR